MPNRLGLRNPLPFPESTLERVMSLPDSLAVRAASQQVSYPLADGAVILGLHDGVYYTVNQVGALIWTLLAQPRTIAELRAAVLAAYDVTREVCDADIEHFVGMLLEARLAEEVHE